jgi:hypothetical protein
MKISHSARAPAIRQRTIRNLDTGDKLRHRPGATCRRMAKFAAIRRRLENFSELKGIAHNAEMSMQAAASTKNETLTAETPGISVAREN